MRNTVIICMTLLLASVAGCQQPYELNVDFAVNRENLRFSKAEKQSYFMVYSNTSWTVDFETPVDWVTLSRTSGSGNRQVSVVCQANESVSRGVNVIVTNQDGRTATIYLSQDAGQNGTYEFDKGEVSLLSKGVSIAVGAETNIPETVFAKAEVNVEYSAGENWINGLDVTPEGLTCSVEDYQGTGSRQAVVTVSFPAAEWDTKKCTASLTISQSAVAPQITVASERVLDAKGCVDAIIPLGFNWAAEYYTYTVSSPTFDADPSWITDTYYDSVSQSIRISAQKNETGQARQALMSFHIQDAEGNAVGDPVSVTLLQDVFVSVDPSTAVALYDGEKYANCYVIENTVSRLYWFDAKKNNGTEPSEQMDLAAVLWQDITCPIDTAFYQDKKIYFKTRAGEAGNAVIVVTDAEKNICWSWHIWVAGEPIGTNTFGSNVLMDRNLGSYGTGDHTRVGTYYQWGRKDPFPGAGSSTVTGNIKRTVVVPDTAVETLVSDSGQAPEWVTAHPGTYIWGSENAGLQDWRSPKEDNLWRNTPNYPKRVDDPCPYGYRVPQNTMLADVAAKLQEVSASGMTMTVKDDNNEDAVFYLGGRWQRTAGDDQINNFGKEGWLWSSNGTGNLDKDHFGSTSISGVAGSRKLNFKSNTAKYDGNGVPRRWGANVRCVKMDI